MTIKRLDVEYNRVYQDTCSCSAIDKRYIVVRDKMSKIISNLIVGNLI